MREPDPWLRLVTALGIAQESPDASKRRVGDIGHLSNEKGRTKCGLSSRNVLERRSGDSLVLILLHHRIRRMVVDGLEVLRLDRIPGDVRVRLGALSHVAYKILDENGMVIRALGDGLFVGALEQAVEFAGGAVLDEPDEVFDPNGLGEACGNCLLYTSPSPRDLSTSRMPSSA